MEKNLKLVTYNIDGLPVSLDLNSLPWLLRPIAWIYWLFKRTTVIITNDDRSKHEMMTYISAWLFDSEADIIAVQEDFNFHHDLMRFLRITYTCGKYTGGFFLEKLFSSVEIFSHFPLPRFKADGLNVIAKDSRVKIISEEIHPWLRSYGYISHANDLVARKGYRLCEVVVDAEAVIDIYNVHMDADFYEKDLCPDVQGDIKARRSQLQQVVNHIRSRQNRGIHHPVIIMGDTNCCPGFGPDDDTINECLFKEGLFWEAIPFQGSTPEVRDVDRVFFLNDRQAPFYLIEDSCWYDTSHRYSDHKPFVVNFRIAYNPQ